MSYIKENILYDSIYIRGGESIVTKSRPVVSWNVWRGSMRELYKVMEISYILIIKMIAQIHTSHQMIHLNKYILLYARKTSMKFIKMFLFLHRMGEINYMRFFFF